MEAALALQPALLLLTSGLLAMLVMPRLGLSPIVGFLIAGIVLGDDGLHLLPHSNTVHLLAELGVVFLLFDIGLHFSMRHIWESRRDILGLGPLQMLLCTLGLAGALLLWSELDWGIALLIGAALALSSTAVASQALVDDNQQRSPLGNSATAVLVFQDIAAIFLLILAASLGADMEQHLAASIGLAFVKSILAFAAAMLIGRYLVTPLFTLLGDNHREGLFTTSALLLVLAAAATTSAAGLSLTLGSFLAGMMISTTAYRHVVRTEIQPFRGLLLGFFFITVGAGLKTEVLVNESLAIAVALFGLISLKAIFIGLAALFMRARQAFAIQLGALLSQGSEFAFVILAMPAVNASVGESLSSILITAVALSMALTGPVTNIGKWLAKRRADYAWSHRAGECVGAEKGEAEVVILAMNKAGRLLADVLTELHIPYKAFDYDHDRFVKARIDGYPVAFGDLADLRLMETIEIANAKVLAIGEPRPEIAAEIGPTLTKRYPKLKRYIAVADDTALKQYPATGSYPIVCHSLPLGIDLSGAVLKALAVDSAVISAWLERKLNQELTEIPVQLEAPVDAAAKAPAAQ